MYSAGSLIGPFFAGPIADRFGRRVAMAVGGLIIVVGCIVVSTAHVYQQLVGGRFILGFGIAILTVGAPALCAEIAPPHWRGRFLGSYNCGWFGGSIPAAAITFGCSYLQSQWAFRVPFLMQGVYGLLVALLVFTVPESPRWLMQNGRSEEALAFLVKYHGNGDPDSALVKLEFEEFQENIALDGSDKRWWDYRALFATKNARWRFLMVMMISVFGQFSGNGLGYFQNVSIGLASLRQSDADESANLGHLQQLGLHLASDDSRFELGRFFRLGFLCPRRRFAIRQVAAYQDFDDRYLVVHGLLARQRSLLDFLGQAARRRPGQRHQPEPQVGSGGCCLQLFVRRRLLGKFFDNEVQRCSEG